MKWDDIAIWACFIVVSGVALLLCVADDEMI